MPTTTTVQHPDGTTVSTVTSGARSPETTGTGGKSGSASCSAVSVSLKPSGGKATRLRPLNRRTNLQCTTLGFGGAHLGELYHTIPDSEALGTVEAAWDLGCRYFDTAPWYGLGLSEHRSGLVLSKHWRQRNDFVLSTKVGRTLRPVADCGGGSWTPSPWAGGMPFEVHFDYSFAGIRRQHADSLQRLGCGRVDALVIHDLDAEFGLFTDPDAPQPDGAAEQPGWAPHMRSLREGGGMRCLEDMRERGDIKAIGAGVNSAEGRAEGASTASNMHYLRRLIALASDASNPLDFLLLAGTHTLLNHTAWQSGMLDTCSEHDIGIIMGGPYNSGILATGAVADAKYDYDTASDAMLDKVRRIEQVCAECGTPLAAAALQFPLAHPAVASVIPGAMCKEHVVRSVDTMDFEVPVVLWSRLKDEGLLPEAIPTPSD